MNKLWYSLAFTLMATCAYSQFTDTFSDGDYTHNPTWTTDAGNFIVNSALQLQSANAGANATFTIATNSTLALNATWEFWVRFEFNPSSVNYVDVWLTSSAADLAAAATTGYFVRLGSADDNISLYKKTGSTTTRLIEGVKGVLNASSSTFKVKVIRTAADQWILLRDMTGEGTSYRSEGEVTDGTHASSSFFGLSVRQSTASFFGKHYFDDFHVAPFAGAPSSLQVKNVRAVAPNTVQVQFDQPVHIPSAENIASWHISGMGNPQSASVDAVDGSVVMLMLAGDLEPNVKKNIIIDGVTDVFGNRISQAMYDLYFYKAGRYDVLINEILADPSPQVALPPQKFIELRNVAEFPVNVFNWRITDGNNTAVLPSVELQPDSFLIITTSSGLEAYKTFGNAISVSGFPSLNIGGSQLALYDAGNSLIHAMSYDLSTYRNEVKKDGGFTLELIDPAYGCGGADNWIASTDASGGTPGRRNSVDGQQMAGGTIEIVQAWLAGADTLMLRLNRTVDSSLAVKKENYQLSDGLSVAALTVEAPLFNLVKLVLTAPVAAGKSYAVTISGFTDCVGSTIGSKKTALFGLAEAPGPNGVVINEVLSEPTVSGGEWVELYNRGDRILDLSTLFIANRNTAGEPASVTRISTQPYLFFPGSYVLLTRDAALVIKEYPFADASVFIRMSSMPSLPNDKGFVLIMDQQGEIIDEVAYNKNWHFALIKDKKGVSLERITFDGPSDKSNFHSAAKDAGYGTPGIKNSQSVPAAASGVSFAVSPEVFSPDQDGIDDFLTISYSFREEGNVTNIKIFDAAGRTVRYLEKNSLSGQDGFYRWDGLDDKNQQLPQGIYIIHFESFNGAGQKQVHKKAVTLARRL